MAVASGRLRAPAFAAPTSRFRGRGAQVLGILAIMVAGYLLWKNEFSWPISLTWEELPRKLDDAQEWLLEQRTEGSNPFFALLDALEHHDVKVVTDSGLDFAHRKQRARLDGHEPFAVFRRHRLPGDEQRILALANGYV